ncbi:MAG: hypothetical protein Tsb0034_18670 [Ekhidna sp.]
MNVAHFHLIVNHLPIVGVLIGALILIVGMLLKNMTVKLTALGVLVFSAITSIFAFYTGEGAEEIVESLSSANHDLIHIHEEYAETFFIMMLILGVVALLGFIAELKKSTNAKYLVIVSLLGSIACIIMAKYVGTSGGEIRHTEIRSDFRIDQKSIEED